VSILDLGNAAREVVASERAAVATRVEDLKRQSEALRQLVVGVQEQHGVVNQVTQPNTPYGV